MVEPLGGAEMRAVFSEAAADAAAVAAGRGWGPLLGLVWRELRDWPGAVLRAHRRALREGAVMGGTVEGVTASSRHSSGLGDGHAPVPWREALPAGLPHPLLAWLAAALVAVLIARAGSVERGVEMALGLSLLVGLAYTYVRTTHARFSPEAPAHYHLPPTALDWWNRRAPGVLASAVLILELLLVRRLGGLRRRSGRMGRLGFRFSLAGLMLLLAADLTASWLTPSGLAVVRLVAGYGAAKALWFTVPAALGGLLSLAGVVMLAAAVGQSRRLRGEVAPLLLTFVLAVVPIAAALPLASDFWDVRTFPRIWGYAVGLPWLALGVWSVIRPGRRWRRRGA